VGEAVDWGRTLAALPRQLEAVLSRLDRGQLSVQMPQVARQIGALDRTVRRLIGGIIFAALLFSGTQFYTAGHRTSGELLLAGAGLALVWALFFVAR